ncbi:MAG: EamA family transporter [Clostridiaceae bacterium]|nr:EamA family transporter [Clostridiaceae bacterium]
MLFYIWPIALVVASNIIYQISAKSVPNDMNPLASLTITYFVGTIICVILYYTLNKDANLLKEYAHTNWAPFALGVVVVGLEVGFIYAYKAGWAVSEASIMQSSFLAVALIFVGYLLYNEAITLNKIIGILICLVGLYIINK